MDFIRRVTGKTDHHAPKASNLDHCEVELLWKKLNHSDITKDIFAAVRPMDESLFNYFTKSGKLSADDVVKFLDAMFDNAEEVAATLLSVFGSIDNTLSSLVSVLAARKHLSDEQTAKILQYLKTDGPTSKDKLGSWLLASPLALPLVHFVFKPILSTDFKDVLPKLSNKSDLLDTASLTVINAQLPMDRRLNWQLLFSTNKQGSSFSQLSQKIHAEGPCLLVIQTDDDDVFGCFASDGFFAGPRYHGNSTSFLFTASPTIQISNATGHASNYAYMNYQQQQMPNGIGIGGQETVWPLFIHEEFGSGICCKNVASFEKIELCPGKEAFSIKALEAWRCGEKPRPFQLEEENPEDVVDPVKHKSILDKDPQARALLELSGRKMHSEAYRDPQPILDDDE